MTVHHRVSSPAPDAPADLAASSSDVERAIVEQRLASVGRRLGVDRILVTWLRNQRMYIGPQWAHSGFRPMFAVVGGTPVEALPELNQLMVRDSRLVVDDFRSHLGSLEVEREWCLSVDIVAAVTVPFRIDGRLAGMVSFHQTSAREWTPDDVAEAKAVGAFMATRPVDRPGSTTDWDVLMRTDVPLAMLLFDLAGEVVAANDAADEMLGTRLGPGLEELDWSQRLRLQEAFRPVAEGASSTAETVLRCGGRPFRFRFVTPGDGSKQVLSIVVPDAPGPAIIDLETLIDSGHVTVEYQPIVGPGDRIVGVEALARVRDPGRGSLSIAEVVTEAEQHGTVEMLDRFVLRTAVHDIAALTVPLRLSVNVSPHSLAGTYVDAVAETIARRRIAPELLQLELTETAALAETRARQALYHVADLGAKVALDDFGTGYGSLAHLGDLPVTGLKLDRTTVRAAVEHLRTAQIASAVVDLAGRFELDVVGEGVETEAERSVLRDMGVDHWQGFLFARSMPVHELVDLLD